MSLLYTAAMLCAFLVAVVDRSFWGMPSTELWLLRPCYATRRWPAADLVRALGATNIDHSLLGMPPAELCPLGPGYAKTRCLGASAL